MAEKVKTLYVCSECGMESARWYGRCPTCGEWNTLQEEIRQPLSHTAVPASGGRAAVQRLSTLVPEGEQRSETGLHELDYTKYYCMVSDLSAFDWMEILQT